MENLVKNKKPFGFYVCSITFAFERAAYYSAKFLLAIFIATAVLNGGLGLTDVEGAKAGSALVAYTYLAPIIGGVISDRYISPRLCVPVGMIIMGIGYVVGAYADSLFMIYVMIALVTIGTGLFKGNISAINGRQFKDKDQLDSVFSLQYSYVNVGSLIGTTLIGVFYLITFADGDVLGFSQSFLFCAALMFVGAAWFIFGIRFLGDAGKLPFKFNELEPVKDNIQDQKPLTKIEKKRIGAIILISFFSVIFWLFWYLAYMPVYYYLPDIVDWTVGSLSVPLSWFDSLNALACIVLGPIFGMLWFKMAKSKRGDLNIFAKTALGLGVIGISYLVLAGTEYFRGDGLASIVWVIAFGLLISIGEMLFSPLGNSFVTKFSPARYLSVMMGVWTFATFVAGKFYGDLYAFIKQYDFVVAYTTIAIIAILCCVILFALNKYLSKLVSE